MDRKVLQVSSLSLSFSDYLPTYLSIFYVSIYLSIDLSIFLSLFLSSNYLSIYLSIYLSTYLSLSLSLSSVYLSAALLCWRPFLLRLGIMSLRWQHVGASHIVLQNTENAKGTSPYSSRQFLFDFHQCWI